MSAPPAPPPYPTELRFRNGGATPLYLHTGCIGVDYGISSCASGYRDALGPVFQCACSCDTVGCTGNVVCGVCPRDASALVDAGQFVAVAWDAISKAAEDRGSYTCLRSQALPAGRYRIAVRVFDDATSAMNGTGGRLITQDFDLPTTDGLDVPLADAQPDPCAGPATAATPACTGNEARDSACGLPLALTYGEDGGLGISLDSAALSPPAGYTLTRTFTDPAMPTQQCMAALPLCSRDARVVTTSDLTRVLTRPDVAAAFAVGTPVIGYDSRPVDGRILVLHRPDGTSLGIGGAVPGSGVPAAFADVVNVLGRLDQQMRGDPACASLAQ